MDIAIRVDASQKIGTGHVMRCLALAQELRHKGARVIFVCRKHPGDMCDTLESEGFEALRMDVEQENDIKNNEDAGSKKNFNQPAHAEWLRVHQDTDARQAIEALQKDKPWDWLVVDHYALDHRWESRLRQVTEKIMVIDDLADRHHDCDFLLDQNYFQEPGKRYKRLLPEKCQTLLGPKYALLRPEFRQARQFCRMRGNGVDRVLVYFGGNDPENLTGMALEALNCPELSHLLVELVAGSNNQHLECLKNQVPKRPGTRFHVQPKYFTELLLRADLCIGAGGITTWERLCLGLPSIVITVAENQEAFTAELDKDKCVIWIGKSQNMGVDQIRTSLIKITNNLNEKTLLLPPDMVDGKGTERVAAEMAKS